MVSPPYHSIHPTCRQARKGTFFLDFDAFLGDSSGSCTIEIERAYQAATFERADQAPFETLAAIKTISNCYTSRKDHRQDEEYSSGLSTGWMGWDADPPHQHGHNSRLNLT
jgi:hypothetical protein